MRFGIGRKLQMNHLKITKLFFYLQHILLLITVVTNCRTTESKPNKNETLTPGLELTTAIRAVPTYVKDRKGWTRDIMSAIESTGKNPTAERICAVVAIVEQESTFQVDPAVKNLPQIVKKGMREKLARLGGLKELALLAILSGKVPGKKTTFGEEINRLRTEKDLDKFYRNLTKAYSTQYPGTYAVASALSWLLGKGSFTDWNPITTAGSMQVKVDYAATLDSFKGLDNNDIRDKLYTRRGGLQAGTARLIDYKAKYKDIIYRFADYNSGIYASRNAAFQKMLSDMSSFDLVLDGDLLMYTNNQDSQSLKAMLEFSKSQNRWEWLVRQEAKKEKTADFEDTEIWNQVHEAWEKKFGKASPYAIMPKVILSSPKFKGTKTTSWFAKNVKYRYLRCRRRLQH